MSYAMFSDDALNKFRTFCDAAGFNKPPSPAGAFDQALKTSQRKENEMSKFRYVPIANAGTSGALYMRSRSTNMAFDEVDNSSEFANAILEFLHDKISEQDLAQVKEYLMMEAGEKPDSAKEAEKMNAAARSRAGAGSSTERDRAGAQDSRIGQAGFNSRFPSARKIGRDDMMGVR